MAVFAVVPIICGGLGGIGSHVEKGIAGFPRLGYCVSAMESTGSDCRSPDTSGSSRKSANSPRRDNNLSNNGARFDNWELEAYKEQYICFCSTDKSEVFGNLVEESVGVHKAFGLLYWYLRKLSTALTWIVNCPRTARIRLGSG
jgi:hypothetical protein